MYSYSQWTEQLWFNETIETRPKVPQLKRYASGALIWVNFDNSKKYLLHFVSQTNISMVEIGHSTFNSVYDFPVFLSNSKGEKSVYVYGGHP